MNWYKKSSDRSNNRSRDDIEVKNTAKKYISLLPSISDNTRLILSDNALDKNNLIFNNYQPEGSKPFGLWYGMGSSWIKWCLTEMPHWLSKYVYAIELDTSQILMMNSEQDLLKFTGKFYSEGYSSDINWATVAEQYNGIEINPYIWESRLSIKTRWYYAWDVASGCVWNNASILDITLLSDIEDINIKETNQPKTEPTIEPEVRLKEKEVNNGDINDN